jgi:hypothetical protein
MEKARQTKEKNQREGARHESLTNQPVKACHQYKMNQIINTIGKRAIALEQTTVKERAKRRSIHPTKLSVPKKILVCRSQIKQARQIRKYQTREPERAMIVKQTTGEKRAN